MPVSKPACVSDKWNSCLIGWMTSPRRIRLRYCEPYVSERNTSIVMRAILDAAGCAGSGIALVRRVVRAVGAHRDVATYLLKPIAIEGMGRDAWAIGGHRDHMSPGI